MFDDETSEEIMTDMPSVELARATDRSPREVEREVISVSVDSTQDQLAQALDSADWLLSRAKAIKQLINQIAIAWIDRHGEFEIGNLRYSVTYSTTTKVRNIHQCGHTLLTRLNGDLDQLFDTLVAQPYKPGTSKRILDKKEFSSLFMTKLAGRLVNGVPDRQLHRADKRFLSQSTTDYV
jgi:hypothetical protein